MNNVVLVGRLTKDPELKRTSNNISYCKFIIAVSRAFNNEKTDFIPVTIWRTQAESCAKHLFKGSLVAVQGSIQTSNFTNSDNQQVYRTDVQANTVKFLSPKSNKDYRNNNNNDFQQTPSKQTASNNQNLNNVFLNDSNNDQPSKTPNINPKTDSNVFDDDPWSEDL